MPTSIPIAEIFGPTVQGEGSLAGRPTYFVRVGGCDFKCAWCDTGYAVNPEAVRGLPRMTQDEITAGLFARIQANPGPKWVSISGGNPAMYDLDKVVDDCHVADLKVTVETQGSKWQPWLSKVDALTISPKPPSSTMTNGQGFTDFMAEVYWWTRQYYPLNASLKVVVFDDADFEFAAKVHERFPTFPFYLSCGTVMGGLSGKWVPPNYEAERDDKDTLMARWRWLVEKAVADPRMADVAIFPQMHALLFGLGVKGV